MVSDRLKMRMLVHRWHRRIGLAAALFAVMLSVTGILLNHTDDLCLDSKPIRSDWILSVYGVERPTVSAFSVGTDWFAQLANDEIYFNGRDLASCRSPMVGAVERSDFTVVACRDRLLLITPEGELIEQLDGSYGLPVPIEGIGIEDGALLLKSSIGEIAADLQALTFSKRATLAASSVWSVPESPPAAIIDPLVDRYRGDQIDWERWLLDLHSGRWFGDLGVWVVDAFGIILMLLAISGVWMWWRRPSRRD